MFTGHGPSALTPHGAWQAEVTAAALALVAPDGVYVSDLPRAMATAEPLLTRTGLKPVVTANLRERDMGTYTGMRFADVEAKDPAGWAALVARDPEFCPPGGESHRACAQRLRSFLCDLTTARPTGRVVIVSHGVAIHHLLRALLGMGDDALTVNFQVDNCSIQRVERRGRLVRVLSINDTAHLVPHGP